MRSNASIEFDPDNPVSIFIEQETGFEILTNMPEEHFEAHLAQITAALIPRYYTPIILSSTPEGPLQ